MAGWGKSPSTLEASSGKDLDDTGVINIEEGAQMRKVVSLLVFATLLAGAFSLAYAVPAFADLKAVVDAICDANTNTIVAVFATPNPSFGVSSGFGVGADCGLFMLFMDSNKWHVIHDMRTGGAWFVSVTPTPPAQCPLGHSCFELIFLKD